MVLASAALAQDATKPAETPAPAKPAAKAAEDKTDAPTKPERNLLYLSAGWADWGFNGNSHRYSQYATPARGFFIRDAEYDPVSSDGRHWGYFEAQAPFQDDYRLNARVQLFNGTFDGGITNNRNRFFATTPQVVGQSEHTITDAYLKQMIGNNFSVSFRNRFDEKQFFQQAPTDPENQHSRYWDMTARGSVGTHGFLDLGYADMRYWDRTQVEPDSDTRRFSAAYRHDFTDNFTLEGTYAHSTIDQDGFSSSKVESWTVGSRWAPTDSTTILANFRQDKLNLPNVQNAYDRARTYYDLRLVQQLPAKWSGQLGYSQLDLERYRGDQSYVDVPRIHTFDAKVSGPLTSAFRLTAKVLRQTLDGKAVMTDIHRTDTAYFRNRWRAQVKVDTTGEYANAYFVYAFNANDNDVRGINIGETSLTAGADWQVRPNISLFGEVSTDRWAARSGNTRTADIGDYFPDGTSWTIGGTWTINPKFSLSAGYTGVMSRNSNPLLLQDANFKGNYFNGTLTYKDPNGWDLALSVEPATYRDHVYDLMNYSANLVSISAHRKF